MKCQNCGFENPEKNKFCGECGGKITIEELPQLPEVEILDSAKSDEKEDLNILEKPNGTEPSESVTKDSKKRIFAILGIIALAIVLISVGMNFVYYFSAEYYIKQNDYKTAISCYSYLGDFLDSKEKLLETKYQWGQKLVDQADFLTSINVLESISDYKNSFELANNSRLLYAKKLMTNKKYKEAIKIYEVLGTNNNADKLLIEANYLLAQDLINQKKYRESLLYLPALGDYKNSKQLLFEVNYQIVSDLINKKDFGSAYEILLGLDGYKDSTGLIKEVEYQLGTKSYDDGEFNKASEFFLKTPGYKDSDVLKLEIDRIMTYQGYWFCSQKGPLIQMVSTDFFMHFEGWNFGSGVFMGNMVYPDDNSIVLGKEELLANVFHLNESVNSFDRTFNALVIRLDENTLWTTLELQEFVEYKWSIDYICRKQSDNITKYVPEPLIILTSGPDPFIGMTAEEARNSSWGRPGEINKTTTAFGITEQWVYDVFGGMKFLYFDDGVLTAISE